MIEMSNKNQQNTVSYLVNSTLLHFITPTHSRMNEVHNRSRLFTLCFQIRNGYIYTVRITKTVCKFAVSQRGTKNFLCLFTSWFLQITKSKRRRIWGKESLKTKTAITIIFKPPASSPHTRQ